MKFSGFWVKWSITFAVIIFGVLLLSTFLFGCSTAWVCDCSAIIHCSCER